MGIIVAAGFELLIGAAVGFAFFIIGLFLKQIIIFDSIALGIVAGFSAHGNTATTYFKPRHIDKGRSILATLKQSLDYGKNTSKTRDGFLISAYGCDPATADAEFLLAKRQYNYITGREQNGIKIFFSTRSGRRLNRDYFREEMRGKPYLHIEIDEHSSGVGIITRVEAFINSLKNIEVKQVADINTYMEGIIHKETNIKNTLSDVNKKKTVYLPYLYAYSEIIKEVLIRKISLVHTEDTGRRNNLANLLCLMV